MNLLTPEHSHQHSLRTLNTLYEYDDFMESVGSMVDLGCGRGLDLEWWATRTTRDETAEPLNIQCMGVDIANQFKIGKKYDNVRFQCGDFESSVLTFKGILFDVLWCHDAFQYALDPLGTLKQWRSIANDNAMLVLIVPQTTNFSQRRMDFYQHSGCYYHYSLVNLIYMLAVTGWDCKEGFFRKDADDPFLHAIVYNGANTALDPKITTWYDLADADRLPEAVRRSVLRRGYLNQMDLALPWIDRHLRDCSRY